MMIEMWFLVCFDAKFRRRFPGHEKAQLDHFFRMLRNQLHLILLHRRYDRHIHISLELRNFQHRSPLRTDMAGLDHLNQLRLDESRPLSHGCGETFMALCPFEWASFQVQALLRAVLDASWICCSWIFGSWRNGGGLELKMIEVQPC